MIIDPQTFRDLEVFEARNGAPSLFDLLNATRTAGGRKALKQRFRTPLSSATEILSVQSVLQFILRHPGTFAFFTDARRTKELEKYLGSNYAPAEASGALSLFLESHWLRLRHRELFDHAVAGLVLTREFLRAAEDFRARLLPLNPPPLLESALRDLSVDTQWLQHIAGEHEVSQWSATEVFRRDREVREQRRDELRRALVATYRLDALIAMAEATRNNRFEFPKILLEGKGHVLKLEGVWHPFLERSVVNDLSVSEEAPMVFLTGPNMAGKTTYMKAAGLAVYLAQLGMGVPATRMTLTPFTHLFTGINTADDVRLGYSYFLSEVRRVREATRILVDGRRAFILFDEMFKGTNVKDAYDACFTVLSSFAHCRQSAAIVSSHLAELAPKLEQVAGVQAWYFDAEIRGGVPSYSYQVQRGSSSQRLGLLLLEQEQLFSLLNTLKANPQRFMKA